MRIVLEAAAVLLGFTVLALLVTWPLASDLDGRIFGLPGDSTGTIALLWQFAEHEGYGLVGTTHMDLTGAPFGWEFPNALNIQWAYVFVPATIATHVIGEIAAYNLVVLTGLVLSGAAMYLLVRSLGVHPLVAAWAGLAYTIFPWHIEKAHGHAGFVHLEGFPLLFLALLAWYRKPVLSRALLVAAASLLLWVTAGYFGLLGAVAVGAVLTVIAAFHWREFGFRTAAVHYAVGAGCALGAAALIFVLSSFGRTAEGVAPERGIGELSTYGARWWEYVLPSYENPLFGDDVGTYLFTRLHGSNFSETSLFVGWLTMVLALLWIGFVVLRRRAVRSVDVVVTVAMCVLVAVALAFSLPSPLPGTDVPTPSRLLWELVPQFRVPSRFVALVMTALVCLAALGLEVVRRQLAGRTVGAVRGVASVALCGVAMAISFVELTIDPEPATTEVDDVPAYVRAVESAPQGALAEYPLVRADQSLNSNYLFWQRVHERELVNGAQLGTFADAVGQAMVNPAARLTAPALAALGVSEIVMRPSAFVLTGPVEPPEALGPGYRLLRRLDSGESVWQVVAEPAPAIAAFGEGFSHAETPTPHETARWMIAADADVEISAGRAGTYLARFKLTSYARPRLIRVAGSNTSRMFTVLNPQTLTVPVRVPSGRSFLRLSSRPGPERVPDGRDVTVYVSNWEFVRGRGNGRPLQAFPR
jgi:hypothetical protein